MHFKPIKAILGGYPKKKKSQIFSTLFAFLGGSDLVWKIPHFFSFFWRVPLWGNKIEGNNKSELFVINLEETKITSGICIFVS